MKRRNLMSLFFVALMFWGCSSAAIYTIAPPRQAIVDGAEWLKSSEETKRAYVRGVLDGTSFFYAIAQSNTVQESVQLRRAISSYTIPFKEQVLSEVDKSVGRLSEQNGMDFTRLSAQTSEDTYIRGLDRIYDDFRNERIPAAVCMRLVNEMASGRISLEDHEAILRWTRLTQ